MSVNGMAPVGPVARVGLFIAGLLLAGCFQSAVVSQGASAAPNKVVAKMKMDQKGGALDAGSTGTPIDNIHVTVPPDTLSQETEITLGYNQEPVTIREGTWCGVTLVLGANPKAAFKAGVTLAIPYTSAGKAGMVVPYEIDEKGRLHVMSIVKLDREKNVLTVSTLKPCSMTWVFV